MKKFFGLVGVAILGGALTLGGYKVLFDNNMVVERTISEPAAKTITANYNPVLNKVNSVANSIDFTTAAENSVHAVVHVKNTAIRTQTNPWAELLYGNGSGTRKYEQVGTGSGVIISPDGYIVTNNHVIDGASDLQVTLNNQEKYEAKLIGTDKENDIALLKIDADSDLPYIPFTDSDNIKIGEWVLAVGNPYNLTSTVTAGIVSAKGRDLEGNSAIDSFIQTDAAVNPGNSGGALVNSKGELVGINTAITSKTGSFIGYSFAVPSNIAKKVVDDLLEFGKVQQAILGVSIDASYDEEGVKIAGITEDAANAKKIGLKAGDIIKKVNNVKITKFSDLKGQLTAKRPGEFVDVTVDRDGEMLVKKVELSKSIERYISAVFQWELKDLSKKELKSKKIDNGVKIIRTGKDESENNLKNYVITKVNNKEVNNAKETAELLDKLVKNRYRVTVEMMNLNGEVERYIYR